MATPDALADIRRILRPHLPGLSRRRTAVYWTDFLISTAIAWSSFLGGAALCGLSHAWIAAPVLCALAVVALWLIAVIALTRATSFLHEVTHHQHAMPLFSLAWDLLVGIPIFAPSYLYVGVHNEHHRLRSFGTERDPEFVEHQGLSNTELAKTAATYAIGPVLLYLRFQLMAPLSWLSPKARRFVLTRANALASNQDYHRPAPTEREARRWRVLEIATFLWASLVTVGVVTALASGVLGFAPLLFLAAVGVTVNVIHGMRSLISHRFGGHGASRDREEMLLDSVNVTGHPILSEVWAPVGLRYHALHHFAPRLPYHSLDAAHRLLLAELPADHIYRDVTFDGLRDLIAAHRAPAEPETNVPVGSQSIA